MINLEKTSLKSKTLTHGLYKEKKKYENHKTLGLKRFYFKCFLNTGNNFVFSFFNFSSAL